jgi:hypothetical protein
VNVGVNVAARARAPYPGLRSFRHDESDLFFGREDFVSTMVDRLAATRFLAVLGSSGTGKSSVVKTGLLDSLELGLMAKAGSSWRVVDFRPGNDPLGSLAKALIEGDGPASDSEIELLRGFLARGPRSVIEWCRDGNLPAGTNLLLLADQFEELFRYQDYAKREVTQALVELLLESAHSTEYPIYVTITMRSEYLGACALLEGLAETISRGLVLIPRMTRDQCRAAIVRPAEVCGIKTDPPLVNELLNDLQSFASWDDSGGADELEKLGRRADQLPLLQYTLNRMWLKAGEKRAKGKQDGSPLVLRLLDYQQIEGLRGALNAHGDQLLEGLAAKGLAGVAEPVFRGLISGATIAEAVRRPRKFGELVELAGGDEAAVRAVVDTFRETGVNFLTPELDPANPRPLTKDTFIDISHESLIRQWGKLSGWLEQEARSAQNWRRLKERKSDFEQYGTLLQGRELAALIAWRDETKPNAKWAERYGGDFAGAMSFLDTSQRAEDSSRLAEQQRLEAIRRAEQDRRRRRIMVSIAAGIAAIVILGGFAVYAAVQNTRLAAALAEADAAKLEAQKAEAEAQDALEKMKEAQKEAEDARKEAQEKRREAAKELGPEPQKGANYAGETNQTNIPPPADPVKDLTGPTPMTIAGAKVLSTWDLWDAFAHNTLGGIILVDVGTDPHTTSIPTANRLPTAGIGIMDKTAMDNLWQALSKLTGSNFDTPIIFFGRDYKDWSGYNAALRAIDMGYDRVYWYRGGIASWKEAKQRFS